MIVIIKLFWININFVLIIYICINISTPDIMYDSEENINAFSIKIATKSDIYGKSIF